MKQELRYKVCPLLVGRQEYKANVIGQGDCVMPVINPCLRTKCVAYKDGECARFDNTVTYFENTDGKSI